MLLGKINQHVADGPVPPQQGPGLHRIGSGNIDYALRKQFQLVA
jgi:hypothetical protein